MRSRHAFSYQSLEAECYRLTDLELWRAMTTVDTSIHLTIASVLLKMYKSLKGNFWKANYQSSKVAAHILPVADPAMLIPVTFLMEMYFI